LKELGVGDVDFSPPYVQYDEPMFAPKRLRSISAPLIGAKLGIRLTSPVQPSPTELTGWSQTMKLCRSVMFRPPSLRNPPRCQGWSFGRYCPCRYESWTRHDTLFSSHCTEVWPPWMFERITVRFPQPTADSCCAPPSTSESWIVSDHALEPGRSVSRMTVPLTLLFLIVTPAARIARLQLTVLPSITVLAEVIAQGPV
jgi:hypothetical protein